MKPSAQPSRTPSKLSDSVHHQLNMYALAASAAGVGMLALAQSADAKIVYTPAHRVIKAHTHYHLDLNHDKKIDFTISNSAACDTSECFYTLLQKPAAGNGGIGHVKGPYMLASALRRGTRIGPDGKFVDQTAQMAGVVSAPAWTFSYVFGPWVNVQRYYLGLRFKIKGQTHYGWARLNVQVVLPPHPAITAVLTGYAYETIANKPIIAGRTEGRDEVALEPDATLTGPTPQLTTLGLLALGSPGLPIWRREESWVAAH
jgi:hypothetical protein